MNVYKLTPFGALNWSYPVANILAQDERSICFEAFFNMEDVDLGYVVMERGDRFVEYFYTDRYYNFYEIYDKDSGLFKGIYGNIARPAKFKEDGIYYEDLALDIWVYPDGRYLILDEEQFERLDLEVEERLRCEEGMQALIKLLTERIRLNEG